MEQAMKQLPESRRLAVHLHHVEGYSTDQIAQICHCKGSTVRTRLHRARKKLRSILGQNAKQPAPIAPSQGGVFHDQQNHSAEST